MKTKEQMKTIKNQIDKLYQQAIIIKYNVYSLDENSYEYDEMTNCLDSIFSIIKEMLGITKED